MSYTLHRKKITKWTLFTFILSSFFYSCQDEGEYDNNKKTDTRTVYFKSDIHTNEMQSRASGVSWDVGDKIGVFMKLSGTTLSEHSIIDSRSNVIYKTSSTDGLFIPETSDQTITYPENNSPVDFIAYYPYKSTISDNFIYKINIQDQSNPQTIDLLYSNNITESSFNQPKNSLQFSRQLSKIKLNIKAGEGIATLNNIRVEILGVKTLADFSLIDGSLSVDNESEVNVDFKTSVNNTTALSEAILLPDNGGENRIIKFHLSNNITFEWEIPATNLFVKGHQYTFNITLNSDGTSIDPSYSWVETPLMNSLSADELYIKHMMPENSKVRNYSMLYDTKYKMAYWVAYPLHNYYIGSSGRTNKWAFDSSISTSFQANLSSSYGISGLDRGHQIPSSDRTSSKAVNATTFYYTNMTPQASTLNQGVWANLEDKVRTWMSTCDTLYVVTGAMVTTSSDSTVDFITNKNDNQKIAKPKYYYKALAKRVNNTYYTVAFKFENKVYTSGQNIKNYQLSVSELEQVTGFTFFPSISSTVKNEIVESQWN